MFALFQQLDGGVLLFLQEHLRCAPLSLFLIPLTIFGGCGTMWIILSVLLLFRPDTRKAGWMALLSLLLCYIFNDLILKELVQRSRPFWVIPELTTLVAEPTSYSFPSGHACSSFAAAHTYWMGLKERRFRWLRWVTMALAALMAFSRLYVGVHYPTDVLAGCLVGFVGSGVIWKLLNRRYDAIEAHVLSRKSD